MDKVNDLVKVLKRLNSGEPVEAVRSDAEELLSEIDATELSLAEQKLVDSGTKPEELRGLCTVHMEMLKDKVDELKAAVNPGHPLRTFVAEHEEILKFLQRLDAVNAAIQSTATAEEASGKIAELKELAGNLVAAENHHRREEEALFPQLERLGITGPPRIMRIEHDQLRPKKHRLLELADEAVTGDYANFKKELGEVAPFIVFTLRDHIFKEDHILYPTALQSLAGEEVWKKIKQQCEEIGYCPFTPDL